MQSFCFILSHLGQLRHLNSEILRARTEAQHPNNEADLKKIVPNQWYGLTGTNVFVYKASKDESQMKSDNHKSLLADIPVVSRSPLLFDVDRSLDSVRTEFVTLCMKMMVEPISRSLNSRVTSFRQSYSFVAASSAKFCNEASYRDGLTQTQMSRLFGGQNVPRIALALMVHMNIVYSYRHDLLSDLNFLKQFRTNLASILSPFVRQVEVDESKINHYFFPDCLDYLEKPEFDLLELSDEERSQLTIFEEPAKTKKPSNTPFSRMEKVVTDSKNARFKNTGKLAPRVAKCMKNLHKVSLKSAFIGD